jgi:hypothetical protein
MTTVGAGHAREITGMARSHMDMPTASLQGIGRAAQMRPINDLSHQITTVGAPWAAQRSQGGGGS